MYNFYKIKIIDTSANEYYPVFNTLRYGGEISEIETFNVELKQTIEALRDICDLGYIFEIYKNDVIDFKGLIEQPTEQGRNLMIPGIDYVALKLVAKTIINRKWSAWNNYHIVLGKIDTPVTAGSGHTITQFSGSAKVALISDSPLDTQLATVYGKIGNSEPFQEKIQLNGTTEVLTTNTFEVWFVSLETAAVGNVSVKEGTGGTVRAVITEKFAAVVDSDGNYGNGVLHDTGIISLLKSGTTDGTTANQLVDSGASFDSEYLNKAIHNKTTNTYTHVTSVVDGTHLGLNDDIFVSGNDYVIHNIDAYSGNTITFESDSKNALETIKDLAIKCIDTGTVASQEWKSHYRDDDNNEIDSIKILNGLGSDKTSSIVLTHGTDCTVISRTRDLSTIVNSQVVVAKNDGSNVIRKSAKDATSITDYGERSLPTVPVLYNYTDETGLQNFVNRIIADGKDPGVSLNVDKIPGRFDIELGDTIRIVNNETNRDDNSRVKSLMHFISGNDDKIQINFDDTGKSLVEDVRNIGSIYKKLSGTNNNEIQQTVTTKEIQTVMYTAMDNASNYGVLTLMAKFPDDLISPADIIECTLTIHRDRQIRNVEADTEILDEDRGYASNGTYTHVYSSPSNGTWLDNSALNHTVGSGNYECHDVYFTVAALGSGGGSGFNTPALYGRIYNVTNPRYFPASNVPVVLHGVDTSTTNWFQGTGYFHVPSNWRNDTIRLQLYCNTTNISMIEVFTNHVDIDGHDHSITTEIARVANASTYEVKYGVDVSATLSAGNLDEADTTAELDVKSYLYLHGDGYRGDGWRVHEFWAGFDPLASGATKNSNLTMTVKLKYYANNK